MAAADFVESPAEAFVKRLKSYLLLYQYHEGETQKKSKCKKRDIPFSSKITSFVSAGLSLDAVSVTVKCMYCSFEPDPRDLNGVDLEASSGFVLLLMHLDFSSDCEVAIKSLKAYVSSDKKGKETLAALLKKYSGSSVTRSIKPEANIKSHTSSSNYSIYEADGVDENKVRELRAEGGSFKNSLTMANLYLRYKTFLDDIPTHEERMRHAALRLYSFKNWPFRYAVSPLALACDGFYWLEKKGNDATKCAYCGIILHSWEDDDIVAVEHLEKSPHCQLKIGILEAEDIPMGESEIKYLRYLMFFESDLCQSIILELPSHEFENVYKKLSKLFTNKENIMKSDKQLAAIILDSNSASFNAKSILRDKNYPAENLKNDDRSLVSTTFNFREDANLSPLAHLEELQSSSVKSRLEGFKEKKPKGASSGGAVSSSHRKPETFGKSKLVKEHKNPVEIEREISLLRDENTKLMESKLCRLCLDSAVDTVFLPCGHLVSCRGCAPKIKNCAICRQLIRGTILAFIPDD